MVTSNLEFGLSGIFPGLVDSTHSCKQISTAVFSQAVYNYQGLRLLELHPNIDDASINYSITSLILFLVHAYVHRNSIFFKSHPIDLKSDLFLL